MYGEVRKLMESKPEDMIERKNCLGLESAGMGPSAKLRSWQNVVAGFLRLAKRAEASLNRLNVTS